MGLLLLSALIALLSRGFECIKELGLLKESGNRVPVLNSRFHFKAAHLLMQVRAEVNLGRLLVLFITSIFSKALILSLRNLVIDKFCLRKEPLVAP